MGGASLPVDASLGRKRQRGGDSTNNEADNDRASKRSRKAGKAKDGTRSKKGTTTDEPRRSSRDRNSGDGSNWWQTTATSATAVAESPANSAAKATTKAGKAEKAGKAVKEKTAKAGRPAKSAGAAEVTESAQANNPTKTARAGKASGSADTATDTATSKARRGRPRTSNASTEAAADASTTNSPVPKRPKKAKTSTAQSPRADEKSRGSKPSKNNKKSGTRVTAETSPTIASPPSRTRAKPKPRQTVEEGEGQQQEEDNDEDESENAADEYRQPFRQLVPRTRLVPLATMTNKWAPLNRDAIAAVQSLLDECARPVLARLGSSSETKDRQDVARQAVAGVSRRLRSKLVKGIPFPTDAKGANGGRHKNKKAATQQAAHATEVSFLSEPAAETHALQSQLTPLQHAVALLARERRREEAALADEYAQLRALETNAQAELRTWRERQRRQHVLADGFHTDPHTALTAGVSRAAVGPGVDLAQADRDKDETSGLFSDSFDSSVVDLASLGNHMESIRGNLQQIDGVAAAMARSRAALQEVLGERLSDDQYERVLLGR